MRSYREQISSVYIYGYGLFRRLFLMAGREMVTRGKLDKADDIFYLTREEIKVIIDSRNSDIDYEYRALAASRKREMEETKDIVLPVVIYGEEVSVARDGKEQESFAVPAHHRAATRGSPGL
ncbi:MAG: hypothetical protein U5L72_03725 [Bacteroidales bacterium]|nr:hypothetical protein [Bacteroidales bacterium]